MAFSKPMEWDGHVPLGSRSEDLVTQKKSATEIFQVKRSSSKHSTSTPRRRPASPPANGEMMLQKVSSQDRQPVLESKMEVWAEERKPSQRIGRLKLQSDITSVQMWQDRLCWDVGTTKIEAGKITSLNFNCIIGAATIDEPKTSFRLTTFLSSIFSRIKRLFRCMPGGDPAHYEEVEAQQYFSQMSCATAFRKKKHSDGSKRHYFVVHYIASHPKLPNLWYRKSILFGCDTIDDASCWAERLQSLASMQSGFRGERPRQLVVFVNPFGGGKQARSVWNDISAPLFWHANVECKVITTEYAGHARKIIESLSLHDFSGINGIVGVGGDGFLGEIINGIMTLRGRDEEHNEALKGIRIGIIPAGSTDTVVVSTTGTRSAETATLHIVIGDRMDIDIVRLQAGEETRYVSSFVGFGFFGEVIRRSESMRWMGPLRYSIAGALSFLRHKSHHIKVSYRRSRVPLSKSVCYSQCTVCENSKSKERISWALHSASLSTMEPGECAETPVEFLGEEELLEEGLADWGCADEKFLAVAGPILSCRCDQSPEGMSKHSHLSDGKITLVMVRRCSHLQFLRFLIRLARKNTDPFSLSFVSVVETSQFRLEPRESERLWNCDGETLAEENAPLVEGTVLQGLVQIFARGPLQVDES